MDIYHVINLISVLIIDESVQVKVEWSIEVPLLYFTVYQNTVKYIVCIV